MLLASSIARAAAQRAFKVRVVRVTAANVTAGQSARCRAATRSPRSMNIGFCFAAGLLAVHRPIQICHGNLFRTLLFGSPLLRLGTSVCHDINVLSRFIGKPRINAN